MRLGKRERAERKAQWHLVKSAKSALVASNLASLPAIKASTHAAISTTGGRKFSTGYRLSPEPKQGYAVRIHWSGMGTGQKGHLVSTGGKSKKFVPDVTWNPAPTIALGLAPDGKKVGKAPRLPAGTGSYRR